MNSKKLLPPTLALAALSALALLSPLASAQDERGMSADPRAIVEAKRAFSRESEAKGMKEAFIAFAADDGVLFRRTVVNAKELWRNTNPAPTALLTWRPRSRTSRARATSATPTAPTKRGQRPPARSLLTRATTSESGSARTAANGASCSASSTPCGRRRSKSSGIKR